MAARVRVRKDRTDDTGYPWHYSVEWPVPEQDAMDYGSLATHGEALACALESLACTAEFQAERDRMADWHARPLT